MKLVENHNFSIDDFMVTLHVGPPAGELIKIKEFHVNCEAGSLGDMLAATAIFKNGRKGSVTVTDSPKIRNFSSIFDKLCEVRFVPSVKYPLALEGIGPTAKRALNALKIEDKGLPYVIPSLDSMEWAEWWLRENKIHNPVVIGGKIGVSKTDNHPLRLYRQVPHEIMQELIDDLSKDGFTPITFGTQDNLPDFKNTISLPDLSITKLSAIYSMIGSYIGCDTGDYHLMLAVGGKCAVLIPDNAWNYNYAFHHYTPDCFDGKCRVRYVNFRDYKSI